MEHKRRHKKRNKWIKQFLPIALVICAVIQLAYHSILSNMIGDIGIGYFCMIMNWLFLLMAFANIGIPYITSKLLAARLVRNQFKNAVKMMQVITCSILLLSVLLIATSEVFARQIAVCLMKESLITFGIRIGVPLLLFYSAVQILRGYFQSFGIDMLTGISLLTDQIFMLATSLFVSSLLYQKGKVVGTFLHNDYYAYLYGATGAIAGIYIGLLISLLFLLFIFWQHYKMIKKQVKEDTTIRLEDIWSVLRTFILAYLPIALIFLIVFVAKTVNLIVFRGVMEKRNVLIDATKQWGLYSAKFQVVMLLPLVIILILGMHSMKSIIGHYRKKDTQDMKKKISTLTRHSMMISFFFAAVFITLAKPMISMLFKGDTVTTVTLMHSGGILPVFMTLAFLHAGLLYEAGYSRMVLISVSIASVIQIAACVAFLDIGKMHIQAIVLADVVSLLVLAAVHLTLSQKYLRFRQEYMRTFILPFASAVLSGIVMVLLQLLFGNAPAAITFIICLLVGFLVYFVCLLVLKALREEDLYDIPYGDVIINIARMGRLL